MNKKRPHTEVDAPAEPIRSDSRQKRRKTQKGRNSLKPLDEKEEKITWAKKRARSIQRRFRRDQESIPANVQNDLERELAAHQQRIAEGKDRKHRSKMISKYHMVRFFERKKAIRLAKKLRAELQRETDPAEVAALKDDIHIAEVDLNYAIYFPHLERYVSLYGGAKSDQPDEQKSSDRAALRSRPPMWRTIEEAMENGKQALEALRDRRTVGGSRGQQPQQQPAQILSGLEAGDAMKLPGRQNRLPVKVSDRKGDSSKGGGADSVARRDLSEHPRHSGEDGDSSDGGFFEVD